MSTDFKQDELIDDGFDSIDNMDIDMGELTGEDDDSNGDDAQFDMNLDDIDMDGIESEEDSNGESEEQSDSDGLDGIDDIDLSSLGEEDQSDNNGLDDIDNIDMSSLGDDEEQTEDSAEEQSKSSNSDDDIDISFGDEEDLLGEQTEEEEKSAEDSDSSFDDFENLDKLDSDSNSIGDIPDISDEALANMSADELERLLNASGVDTKDIASDTQEDTLELESVDDAVKRLDSIDADHDGAILDSDSLMTDSFETVTEDNNFISETGNIVVMDTSENGDNFKFQYIDIEKIAVVKRIRKNNTNVEDLVQSIKSTGLLEPLVVAPTATDGMYVLLAGFRRIMACAKAGKRKIPCIVNVKIKTQEIPILEALYNHSKSYTIKEIVDYIDYLEKEKGIMSASMIEYLLQLNSGDYTKLKDILNDNDDDIVSKLFDGIYTIEMAFKKLEQRRKKESAEEKENKKAARVYEDEAESGADSIAGAGESTNEDDQLSEEEIQGLAFSASNLDEVDDEDFTELEEEGKNIEGFEPNKQDYRDRQRLDPALRQSVLDRDKNTCQICKIASGQEFRQTLDVHHIVEVYLGGDDSMDNLITACTVCHKLIHLYGRGELYIRPVEEFDEVEKARFKRIMKLGNIIRKGMAAKGLKREQLKKMDATETIGRTKPGTEQVAG